MIISSDSSKTNLPFFFFLFSDSMFLDSDCKWIWKRQRSSRFPNWLACFEFCAASCLCRIAVCSMSLCKLSSPSLPGALSPHVFSFKMLHLRFPSLSTFPIPKVCRSLQKKSRTCVYVCMCVSVCVCAYLSVYGCVCFCPSLILAFIVSLSLHPLSLCLLCLHVSLCVSSSFFFFLLLPFFFFFLADHDASLVSENTLVRSKRNEFCRN